MAVKPYSYWSLSHKVMVPGWFWFSPLAFPKAKRQPIRRLGRSEEIAAAVFGCAVLAQAYVIDHTLDSVMLHRARMILVGLAAAFLRCSLALMGGQNGCAVALDLFVVCLFVQIINMFSYTPISKVSSHHHSSYMRMVGGNACYIFEMFGTVLLFFGAVWGLTMAAVAMIANFSIMILCSWLLLLSY